VALLALGRKSQRAVVRIRRVHVRYGMATDAIRLESHETPDRRSLVALFAIEGRVCTDQREPVLVIPNLVNRRRPALHRVAAVALRAHAAAMNIGVTVAAVTPDVAENRLQVALRAGHGFVHAGQRIWCGVVIELRVLPNGPPTAEGVTVLAGDIELSVGTAGVAVASACRRALLLLWRSEQRQAHRDCCCHQQ